MNATPVKQCWKVRGRQFIWHCFAFPILQLDVYTSNSSTSTAAVPASVFHIMGSSQSVANSY